MAASGRPLSDHRDGTMFLGRLQPDLALVSDSLRKIAIVEESRPMDGSKVQRDAKHTNQHRTPVAASLTLMTWGDPVTENGGDDRTAT
jgi:hypothetical protein